MLLKNSPPRKETLSSRTNQTQSISELEELRSRVQLLENEVNKKDNLIDLLKSKVGVELDNSRQ